MKKLLKKLLTKYLTNFGQKSKTPKTREIQPSSIREVSQEKFAADSFKCPYCLSQNFFKRGFRKKKHEKVQMYQCKDCKKTFTQQISKGKHYPLSIIFKALNLYNLGYSLKQVAQKLNYHTNYLIQPTSVTNWLNEYSQFMPYQRMRSYALKKYSPENMVIAATLTHKQVFQYRFHRAKCQLIIEDDFKHRRFGPIQEYLSLVPSDCPHQHFTNKKTLRASQSPIIFSKKQMIVRSKINYANKLCQFILQSVKQRQKRHQALQDFMLCNDSVTVATEVPVYIEKEDLIHLQTQLGFEMYVKTKNNNLKQFTNSKLPKIITGHIDILQIRNGQIHIIDYKPKAEKIKPIEQLTLYAMALSRLTGLRLFDFKCAWFDENDYFEFFPLHVLHKPKSRRRRKRIQTQEGTYLINQLKNKILTLKPKYNKPNTTIN